MFDNLKTEMLRGGIKQYEMARVLHVSTKTVTNKMTGKSEFTRKEMFIIKKKYFPNCSIDYLFYRKKGTWYVNFDNFL